MAGTINVCGRGRQLPVTHLNRAVGPNVLLCAVVLALLATVHAQPIPDTILLPDSLGPTWTVACSLSVRGTSVRWAVGDSGKVLKTTNGDTTARYVIGKGQYDLCGVAFADPQHGWIVGNGRNDQECGRGVVFRTTSGGDSALAWIATFPVTRQGINVPLLRVQAVDAMRVWVLCGNGYTLRSHDGGLNWLVGAKRPTVDAGGEIENERH
jgi:photosystem II stability/assembly factor-like uncharacterized protein